MNMCEMSRENDRRCVWNVDEQPSAIGIAASAGRGTVCGDCVCGCPFMSTSAAVAMKKVIVLVFGVNRP